MTERPTGSDARTRPEEFDWLSLDDGEEILWADGPDRRTLIPAVAVGIPLAIVLVGIAIIVGEYLRVTNTHYVVTNRALYRKSGILSRDVKRIDFEKVQNISYTQSALGNHFGYGTVEISTAGGTGVEMAFSAVANPREVQALVSDRTERGRSEADEDRSTDDVLDEILVELRAIRSTIEAEGVDDRGTATGNRDRESIDGRDTRRSDDRPGRSDADDARRSTDTDE